MSQKGGSRSLITIPRLAAKYKEVRVTLLGLSCFRIEGDTTLRFADEDFGLFVLNEVFDRQSILSKRKGVLRKTHNCRKCETDLMGLRARRRRFAITMQYKQLPSFKLEIEMPAMSCPKCATSNAVNEEGTQHVIGLAIAKAFESLKARRLS